MSQPGDKEGTRPHTISESWRDWGAFGLSASTGLGYAVGLGGVALLSRRLDILPSDLELTFADYLFLAAAGVVLWAVAGAIFLAASSLSDKAVPIADIQKAFKMRATHGRMIALRAVVRSFALFLAGTAGQTAVILAAFGVAVLTGVDLFVALASVGALSVMVWAARRTVRSLLVAMVTFAVITSGITLATADRWGQEIRNYASGEIQELKPRWPFAVLLNPEEGEAIVGGASWCVVRLSDRVFVGRELVVVTTVDTFRATSCRVDRRPFSP